jgi:hypothetical protein
VTWSNLKVGDLGVSLLTGVGVAVIAPILLPVAGAILRLVLKEVIKVSLFVADTLNEVAAESEEHLSNLIAEAKAEYAAGNHDQAG